MKQKKRVKSGWMMALLMLAGALLGGGAALWGVSNRESVTAGLEWLLDGFTLAAPFAALALAVCCVPYLALQCRRAQGQAARLSPEDDEGATALLRRADRLVGLLEGAFMLVMVLGMAGVCGIAPGRTIGGLPAAAALLGMTAAYTWLLRRLVGLMQRLAPEKKGDTYSFRFSKDWYQSCDEAERQAIGFASYQALMRVQSVTLWLLAACTLLGVVAGTGPLPVLVTGALWCTMKFSMLHRGS